MMTIPDLLATRAIAIIKGEAAGDDRDISDIELKIERDYLAVRLVIDRAPVLVYLGIRASTALADLPAFDDELQRIIRLIFDARPQ